MKKPEMKSDFDQISGFFITFGDSTRRVQPRLLEYLRDILSAGKQLYWRVTGTVHGTPRVFGQFVTAPKLYIIAEAARTIESLYSQETTPVTSCDSCTSVWRVPISPSTRPTFRNSPMPLSAALTTPTAGATA